MMMLLSYTMEKKCPVVVTVSLQSQRLIIVKRVSVFNKRDLCKFSVSQLLQTVNCKTRPTWFPFQTHPFRHHNSQRWNAFIDCEYTFSVLFLSHKIGSPPNETPFTSNRSPRLLVNKPSRPEALHAPSASFLQMPVLPYPLVVVVIVSASLGLAY